MKKVTLFAAMAALVFVSCNKDEGLQLEMSNNTITASMESDAPETRTAFNRESGALYWIAGDDIAVLNTSGTFTEYTLSAGAGTADATFTAKAKNSSNAAYALHPYSSGHKYENSDLTFNLPDSYTYEEAEKGDEYGVAPMIAQTEETDASDFYFEHLGGAFFFTIKNLPAGTTYFKLEADEQITGDFSVVTNPETGKFEISLPDTQTASAVTVNFPAEQATADKKFFIPLPVGTIDGFRISVGTSAGETWSYTSTKSNTITRKKLLAMPEVSAAASVSTETELKDAIGQGGNIVLSQNITLTAPLTVEVGKNVSIDLNGKELITSTSKGNDDITVKGTLNVYNGTVTTASTAFLVDGGSMNLKDCMIENTSTYTAVGVMSGGKLEVSNCTANVLTTAFMALAQGHMTLNNCVATASNDQGNVLVQATGQSTLIIEGGSYTGKTTDAAHDRYVIGVKGGSMASINTTVRGGNGGVSVIEASTVEFLGGSYTGLKACGLYVAGNSKVAYSDNCAFSGVEGNVVVGGGNAGSGTVNDTEYTEYTKVQ